MRARWYERAFGEDYLEVYAHRDEREARAEAAFAVRALGLRAADRVLDLACGAGRHARSLSGLGLRVVGYDLSAALLRRAAKEGDGPDYVLGDMRRLSFRRAFDGATMFFTSFGYFGTEREDRAVLGELFRVLRTDGGLLLDLMNREVVIRNLVPESRRTVGDLVVDEVRAISVDGRRVEKRIEIRSPGGSRRSYEESVRLYSAAEAVQMLQAAGFSVSERYGDLAGAPFSEDSRRLVIVGRAR